MTATCLPCCSVWQPGEDVIVPPPGSCGTAKERMEKPSEDVRCLDWFMCLKKCPK